MCIQAYSNGLSEVVLGKAIKQLGLPREELVIMTKVGTMFAQCISRALMLPPFKLYFAVPKGQTNIWASGVQAEDLGIINQKGLNRKVRCPSSPLSGFH